MRPEFMTPSPSSTRRDTGAEGGAFARSLHRLTAAVAIAGGLLLIASALLTVIHIVGRNVASVDLLRGLPVIGLWGPIPGDVELVENAVAVAIFCFLPYCQIVRGHVSVDFFVGAASPRGKAWFAAAGNLLFALVAALVAWQLCLATIDRMTYGETSFVLRLPLWWFHAPAVAAFALLTIVCLFTVWRSIGEARGEGEPAR